MKRILASLLIFAVIFSLVNQPQILNVGAVSLEEQVKIEKKKLEQLEMNQKQKKEEEKELEYKIAGLSQDMAVIEKKLTDQGRDLQLLEQELSLLKAEYTLATNQLEMLEQSIADKEKKLDKILLILYKNYSLNYIAYLFSSKSLSEILDRTLYLQYLFQANKSYMGNLKVEREKRKGLRLSNVDTWEKYYDKKSIVDKSIANYSSLEKQKGQQLYKETISKKLNEQQQRENELEMQRTEDFVKNLLRKIAEKAAEEARKKKLGLAPWGKIQWPLAGKVSSGFGMRLHPIFGDYRMHTGIDIDAGAGVPIHACAKGIVVYAGWLSGYGNVVIIQHDTQHSSLYAHQRAYYVKVEQEVSLGEVIGEVGTTGWSTEPHLHFEIRVNGDPVNPMNYLP